jgi:hypothetical protein
LTGFGTDIASVAGLLALRDPVSTSRAIGYVEGALVGTGKAPAVQLGVDVRASHPTEFVAVTGFTRVDDCVTTTSQATVGSASIRRGVGIGFAVIAGLFFLDDAISADAVFTVCVVVALTVFTPTSHPSHHYPNQDDARRSQNHSICSQLFPIAVRRREETLPPLSAI